MVDFFTASVATGYELVYLDKVDIAGISIAGIKHEVRNPIDCVGICGGDPGFFRVARGV